LGFTRPNHQTPDRRGDGHVDGSGEDRVSLGYQAKRHCDVTLHTNYPNYVSDRIGHSDFWCPCGADSDHTNSWKCHDVVGAKTLWSSTWAGEESCIERLIQTAPQWISTASGSERDFSKKPIAASHARYRSRYLSGDP